MKKLFNNQIKLIKSLGNKKGRGETGLFVAEGRKAVKELLKSQIKTEFLVFDKEFPFDGFMAENKNSAGIEFYSHSVDSISSMKSSEGILAVAKIPLCTDTNLFFNSKINLLGLFGISDPGNMGTLLRTAYWFGLEGIVLYDNCADVFSPKVIRSSMGSVFHIDILEFRNFTESSVFLDQYSKIGTFLDEKNNYKHSTDKKKIIFLGNEANGLDNILKDKIDFNFRIDSAGKFDSLNVSVAGGIIINEIFNTKRGSSC
ncbi:MAG: RNA methyltransferase [Candidatus Delongbacteria bacterium]|nr:RNA methyltransferase [Candidatus Delongbacteria bacterium]